MVFTDDYRLLQLRPLFSPAAVSNVLTKLELLGEDCIRAAAATSGVETPYSTARDARMARAELHVTLLIALRRAVRKSNRRELLQKWCKAASASAATASSNASSSFSSSFAAGGYHHGRAGVEQRVRYQWEEEVRNDVHDGKTVAEAGRAGSDDDKEEEQMVNVMIELPCMLILVAFSLTYLPGIPDQLRPDIIRTAVLTAQKDGDLIVRDDITMCEIIEFGMEIANVPRERWLRLNPVVDHRQGGDGDDDVALVEPSTFLSVKTMALLWSLTVAAASCGEDDDSVSSRRHAGAPADDSLLLIPVLSDPHLLLWSAWSTISVPDAIVVETAQEALDVFGFGISCGAAAAAANHAALLPSEVKSAGVAILLVQDPREWSEESLISISKKLVSSFPPVPVSIWIDSHTCGHLCRSLSSSALWWPTAPVLLQWVGDALSSPDCSLSPCTSGAASTSLVVETPAAVDKLVRRWIKTAVLVSGVVWPQRSELEQQRFRKIQSACYSCIVALDAAATGLCSGELAKSLCTWKQPAGSPSLSSGEHFCSSCWLGLLAHIVPRIPDVLPNPAGGGGNGSATHSSSSSSSVSSSAVDRNCGNTPGTIDTAGEGILLSAGERHLWSLRAASPPLPPGISMSPDALLVYRMAEQLPLDFWAAFWVELLLLPEKKNGGSCTVTSSPSSSPKTIEWWKADPTLVKMSARFKELYPSLSSSSSSSASSSSASATTAATAASSTVSSESMTKAFTFVLESWWDGELTTTANLSLEESVGRLKNVADVIDRHRTVEVRAYQHSVAASRSELRQIVDAALQQRFATVEQQLQIAASSAASGEKSATAAALDSAVARQALAASWRTTAGANAAKNARVAMTVAQQVGSVFEREAEHLVQRLLDGGNGAQPLVILRLRPELQRIRDYYAIATNTAALSIGGKGRQLLRVSDKLQANIRLISEVL